MQVESAQPSRKVTASQQMENRAQKAQQHAKPSRLAVNLGPSGSGTVTRGLWPVLRERPSCSMDPAGLVLSQALRVHWQHTWPWAASLSFLTVTVTGVSDIFMAPEPLNRHGVRK